MSTSPSRASFPKVAHVPRVQEIEDAVGEDDRLPVGPKPFDQGERLAFREHEKTEALKIRAVRDSGPRTGP